SAGVLGGRRAGKRTARSLILGSSSQELPTSAIEGPSHIDATDISGTFACIHGQSGSRGSAAAAGDGCAASTMHRIKRRAKNFIVHSRRYCSVPIEALQ